MKMKNGNKLTKNDVELITEAYKLVGKTAPKKLAPTAVEDKGDKSDSSEEMQKKREEKEKFFSDRYEGKVPRVGDRISYAVIPVDKDGRKDVASAEYREGEITGYTDKTNSIIVKRVGGKDTITLDELDLFYGKSTNKPSGIASNKQYRHIQNLGNDGSMFDINAEFSDISPAPSPTTTTTQTPTRTERGGRRRGGRSGGVDSGSASIEIGGETRLDPDGILNSDDMMKIEE